MGNFIEINDSESYDITTTTPAKNKKKTWLLYLSHQVLFESFCLHQDVVRAALCLRVTVNVFLKVAGSWGACVEFTNGAFHLKSDSEDSSRAY